MAEADNDVPSRTIKLFGRDLSKVECLRNSLLNGYYGAAIGGIAGLFYKSKVTFACHSAFVSYWIVSASCWYWCRYQKYKREKLLENIKGKFKKKKFSEDEYILPNSLLPKVEEKGLDNELVEKS